VVIVVEGLLWLSLLSWLSKFSLLTGCSGIGYNKELRVLAIDGIATPSADGSQSRMSKFAKVNEGGVS